MKQIDFSISKRKSIEADARSNFSNQCTNGNDSKEVKSKERIILSYALKNIKLVEPQTINGPNKIFATFKIRYTTS